MKLTYFWGIMKIIIMLLLFSALSCSQEKNNNEFSANFPLNNLNITKAEIEIENDLFNPNACVFLDNGEIYWSLVKVTNDMIIINGCGEEYKYLKDDKKKNKEFFK